MDEHEVHKTAYVKMFVHGEYVGIDIFFRFIDSAYQRIFTESNVTCELRVSLTEMQSNAMKSTGKETQY